MLLDSGAGPPPPGTAVTKGRCNKEFPWPRLPSHSIASQMQKAVPAAFPSLAWPSHSCTRRFARPCGVRVLRLLSCSRRRRHCARPSGDHDQRLTALLPAVNAEPPAFTVGGHFFGSDLTSLEAKLLGCAGLSDCVSTRHPGWRQPFCKCRDRKYLYPFTTALPIYRKDGSAPVRNRYRPSPRSQTQGSDQHVRSRTPQIRNR